MAQYMNVAAVTARASIRSEMWPARIPPTTPPTSNRVDSVPAVESDRYSPSIAAKCKIKIYFFFFVKMQVVLHLIVQLSVSGEQIKLQILPR